MDKRLYLRLHDTVFHGSHEEWGEGIVVEEMTSSLPGGTCLVRIRFADGRQRTFNNDMDNDMCCYYFGVRKRRDAQFRPLTGAGQSGRRRLSR